MPAIEFTERRTGSAVVTIDAGEEIEIQANGDMLLKAEVPEGKIWKTTISVQVVESDV